MKKEDILAKLYEKKGAESDSSLKERLDNICNILRMMPEDEISKTVLDTDIDKLLNGPDSCLDGGIGAISERFLDKLKAWIANHPHTAETCVLESMNKRTKCVLKTFLVFIGILAAIAVPFAILNFIYGDDFFWGRGNDIVTVLGVLDFAIGAMGFVWERIDDLKKKQLRSETEKVKETGDPEKFIKICKSNINTGINSGIIGGLFNKVINK